MMIIITIIIISKSIGKHGDIVSIMVLLKTSANFFELGKDQKNKQTKNKQKNMNS